MNSKTFTSEKDWIAAALEYIQKCLTDEETLKKDEMQGKKSRPTEAYSVIRRGGSDALDAADRLFQSFPKTIALCGGQTVKPLYQALSQTPLAQQAHFFQTDERFVPATHPDSNQKMIREILKPTNFTSFNTDLPIEKSIEDYTAKIPTQFDLIILSLGPDGHIASIFPDTPESTEPVTHTIAPKEFAIKDRLTLTMPTMLKAKNTLLLAKNRDTTIKRLEEENLPAERIIKKTSTILQLLS